MKPPLHYFTLKGISGILFGIISILFIWIIQLFLTDFSLGREVVGMLPILFFEIFLVVFSFIYILISYFTITLINKKRIKKNSIEQSGLNSKKIRNILFRFLFTGGILTYYFVSEGYLKLIIPTSLFLCGMVSLLSYKYTKGASFILGILLITNGITSLLFPQFMFYIWGIGFGVYPIIYGIYSFKKV